MIGPGLNLATGILRYAQSTTVSVTGTGVDTKDFTGELLIRQVCAAATAASNTMATTIKSSGTATGAWTAVANPTTTGYLTFSTVTTANSDQSFRVNKSSINGRYLAASISITTTTGDAFYPMIEILGYKTYTT